MITDYNEYLHKLEYLNIERILTVKRMENKIQEDAEDICAKYLPMIQPYKTNMNKIFIIDDDYGMTFTSKFYEEAAVGHKLQLRINSVFPDARTWVKTDDNNSSVFLWKEWHNISIEDFVKNAIEELKKRNVKRKMEKEKRELKKNMKKYNL